MFPKGGMGGLMKQAQKMQEKMQKIQEELETIEVEGTSGGSMVTIRATAKQKILSVKIDPEAIDPEDVEMLEDLVVAAINQALTKATEITEQKMAAVTGGLAGMKLPGM